jgi:predicted  nucleic acid-binding Zn-ribbon protein
MAIKEDINGLVRLQEIDSRLQEIEDKRDVLKQAIQKVREPLNALETERDVVTERMETLQRDTRNLEGSAAELTDRIQRSSEKLPLITTQKEYFALQKEIETMAREKERLEETLLANMGTLEELQKEAVDLANRCTEEETNFVTRKDEMERDAADFDTETAELNQQRKSIATGIDARYLAHYNKVVLYKGSPVVVKIVDGNCRGCHMTLPPQLFNDVRRGDSVITCSFCNRILYVES